MIVDRRATIKLEAMLGQGVAAAQLGRNEIPDFNVYPGIAQAFQNRKPAPKPEEPKPDYLGFVVGSLALAPFTGGASLAAPAIAGGFRGF